MGNDYQRGSEWYRWDLHIHTPKSIIQNFGGDNTPVWNEFIQRLAVLPPKLKVIGITDYLFCDGYEYILTRKNELQNIDLIIPNIEFRLDTFSGTAHNKKRHNFHVLFDPSVTVQQIREQLLNCLSTGYKIEDKSEWNQTPTTASLSELGRAIKAAAPADNAIHNKSDLEVGFDNITYSRKDIEKLLNKSCFKGRFVTAIGYSEWDQSRWDQSAANKRTLINNANFCLTSSNDPEKIEKNKEDLQSNNLNSLILQSSDAHEIAHLNNSLLWIKADPTFAGLKQVLNEPDARVFIGETPPNVKPDHRIISSLSIPNSNGWFADNFKLELNCDLVAIIGGRGSGKSALAEAIAYGAGSFDKNDDAFLKKATIHKNSISGVDIQLEWADEVPTNFKVGSLTQDCELVRYLPQGVVEELCSHKNSDVLQQQIEKVIFDALEETDRIGASNFEELKKIVLKQFQFENDTLVNKIGGLNKKIFNLSNIIKSLPEKNKILIEKKAELQRLISSLPELPPEDKQGQEELAALIDFKKKFENKITNIKNRLNLISDLETKVKIIKEQIDEFAVDSKSLLSLLEIDEISVFDIKIDEEGIKSVISKNRIEANNQLEILIEGEKIKVAILLETSPEKLPADNLKGLNKLIDDKQKETKAFETTKIKYQKQKQAITSLENSIISLAKEITTISRESEPEKKRLEQERINNYFQRFELLKLEKEKIEELYKPLQATLELGTETDKKLVFEAKFDYQINIHCKNGLDILDRSRKGNFREFNNLNDALRTFWHECLKDDFSIEIIKSQLNSIIQSFENFEGESIEIKEQLRENYTEEDFYNWLFNPATFRVVSSLKFDGTDLYLLSPGQKGIILLMLYLEIDKADTRPLIIDQPEENLDNLSVYKDLINYFRSRKLYRQIIIVTHNPNLVVNTDAEQIIIANYNGLRTPRLEYISGSLENQAQEIPEVAVEDLEDGIIEQVCNILEGGENAFQKRKKKYQISTKSQI